jgi:hypothetical protein
MVVTSREHQCADIKKRLEYLQRRWYAEWLQDLLIVWGLSRGGHKAEAQRLLQALTLRQAQHDRIWLPYCNYFDFQIVGTVYNARNTSQVSGAQPSMSLFLAKR